MGKIETDMEILSPDPLEPRAVLSPYEAASARVVWRNGYPPPPAGRVDPVRGIFLLYSYRRVILASVLVFVLAGLLYTKTVTPLYQATARLQLDTEESNILPYKDIVSTTNSPAAMEKNLFTQYKLLSGDALARPVIEKCGLDKPERLAAINPPGPVDYVRNLVRSYRGAQVRPAVACREDLYRDFLSMLKVHPIRGSTLVDVSFRSTNPGLSATVVNALVSEFRKQQFETRLDAAEKASQFLSNQIEELGTKLAESEQAVLAYAREQDVVTSSDGESVVEKALKEINSSLNAAIALRVEKESLWRIARRATQEGFPDILKTPQISAIEARILELLETRAKMTVHYLKDWPALVEVDTELTETRRQLSQERAKAIQTAIVEYEHARSKEKLLQRELNRLKTSATRMNERMVRYDFLAQEADTNKKLYDDLQERLKQASISAGLNTSRTRVIQEAQTPTRPIRPRPLINLALALAAGLAVGLGCSLLHSAMDRKVQDKGTLTHLGFKTLGVIPLNCAVRSPETLLLPPGQDKRGKRSSYDYGEPGVVVSESYRSLRTTLLLSGQDRSRKTILITSSRPGEGKTISAVNLSVSLAASGKKVLIVDGDLRKPTCHQVLGIENTSGLGDFLSGSERLPEIIKGTSVPGLRCITAGTPRRNPADLLGDGSMRELLGLAAKHVDFVIIDTPPVLSVSDALILCPMVDGVVLVVNARDTREQLVMESKSLIEEVNGRIFGVILNKVEAKMNRYGPYSYRYPYGGRGGAGYPATA